MAVNPEVTVRAPVSLVSLAIPLTQRYCLLGRPETVIRPGSLPASARSPAPATCTVLPGPRVNSQNDTAFATLALARLTTTLPLNPGRVAVAIVVQMLTVAPV